MISYEPPEQEAFGVGDYIDGIGTVLDPDDDEMAAFIEEMASRAKRAEIKLVKCIFCGEYGQWEMWHIYDPWEMRHILTPVCYSCRRQYFVGCDKAREVVDEWTKEDECKQLTEGA